MPPCQWRLFSPQWRWKQQHQEEEKAGRQDSTSESARLGPRIPGIHGPTGFRAQIRFYHYEKTSWHTSQYLLLIYTEINGVLISYLWENGSNFVIVIKGDHCFQYVVTLFKSVRLILWSILWFWALLKNNSLLLCFFLNKIKFCYGKYRTALCLTFIRV